MSLDDITEALENLPLGRREDSPGSDDSDAKSDGGFFCIEDTFLSSDVDVSVNDIGPINFPIEQETVEKLIGMSEKAVFGRGTKTVLDTSYRDTQTIPASKITVQIDQESLENVLERIEEELNVQKTSKLELHLYNMLIYGPGQFFKRHRDTEKVPNMVATLVMVLPSAHKGGGLIINHHGLKHKFFGSKNPKIIKCVTFYSDCYHEVEEVTEGYRVALTYNVELKFGPAPDLGPVDEDLQVAVNNYFEETDNDKLVYYLDHQYTEHSLKWYLLKGKDRTRAKALLAVAKLEGYCPCLALAEYHESYPEDCEEDAETDTELYFWVDENNLKFDIGKIEVSEEEICFTTDTKEAFNPHKREEEGHQGNWAGNIDEWYHRSSVVLWRSTWCYLQGYKMELAELHRLASEMEDQSTLLKKLQDNERNFFLYKFWDDDSVKKMLLDIAMYLSDAETTEKIFKKFKPSEVFNMAKPELATWIAYTWNLELWKTLVGSWKSAPSSENLLASLLPFLQQYVTIEDKNLEVAEYLLNETANLFMNPKKETTYSYWGDRNKTTNKQNDERLCALLQISFQLGNLELEKNLMKNASSGEEAAQFQMFEEALDPKQFARISQQLLLNMAQSFLEKIEKERTSYRYSGPTEDNIKTICSLLKNSVKLGNGIVEERILAHILSDQVTFTTAHFKMFLRDLQPELFVKFSGELLVKVTKYTLGKIEKASVAQVDDVQNICSLLQYAVKMKNTTAEQLILSHITSDRGTYTAAHFKVFEQGLQPELFVRFSRELLLKVTKSTLGKMENATIAQGDVLNICVLLQYAIKMENTTAEQLIVGHMTSDRVKYSKWHLKMFEEALGPKEFLKISAQLLLNITKSELGKIVNGNENYFYAEPKPDGIQTICFLLESAIKSGNSTIEQQILGHIISNRSTYTASFLAELFVKMKNVLGDRVKNYTQLKAHVLLMIDQQISKLSNPNDVSLPIKHPCNCQFCTRVTNFLGASNSSQVSIPTAERNRNHITNYLNGMRYLPIKLETIRMGSPHQLVITKLPKLQADRQNLLKRLMICKKAIVEIGEVQPENPLEVKKIKIEQ